MWYLISGWNFIFITIEIGEKTPRIAGHFLFDIDNRVEIQKLNQVAAELPPGWVFGVQLGVWQIQALIKIKTEIKGKTKKNNYVVEILSIFAVEMVEKNLNFSYLLIKSLDKFWGQFWVFHVLIYSWGILFYTPYFFRL